MNELLLRAASVLVVAATVYVSADMRASAGAEGKSPADLQAACIMATYGTTTEAMQRVYGSVPKCI